VTGGKMCATGVKTDEIVTGYLVSGDRKDGEVLRREKPECRSAPVDSNGQADRKARRGKVDPRSTGIKEDLASPVVWVDHPADAEGLADQANQADGVGHAGDKFCR
jgi:hypothetical protein